MVQLLCAAVAAAAAMLAALVFGMSRMVGRGRLYSQLGRRFLVRETVR